MLTRKRSKPNVTCKTLYGGEIFWSSDDFPSGLLPTKRQVIKHMLNLNHFRKRIAYSSNCWIKLYNRWIWCSFYFIHDLSIARKIDQLMQNFSDLTRYLKKSKTSDRYKELKTNFLQDAEKRIIASHFRTAVGGQQFRGVDKILNENYVWTLLFLFPLLPIVVTWCSKNVFWVNRNGNGYRQWLGGGGAQPPLAPVATALVNSVDLFCINGVQSSV